MFGALGTIVGLVSGVLTIIAFFIPINSRRARLVHAAYVLVVSGVVSIATYQSVKLSHLNDIAWAADRLVTGRQMNYTHRGYVLATLSFLEKNKDLFPETYERAISMCQKFKCDDPASNVDMVELAFSFDGIIKGLGAMSK